MRKLIIIVSVLFLSACAINPPDGLFSVTPEILAQRQLQIRKYEGIDENAILFASANLLQDLGYNLENSETKLGVITAAKQRDATNAGEVAAAILVALLGGGAKAVSKDQTIRVALVVRSLYDEAQNVVPNTHLVRVTFQRVVRRTDGSTIAQTLADEDLYKDFYDRLSKAVFIEAEGI